MNIQFFDQRNKKVNRDTIDSIISQTLNNKCNNNSFLFENELKFTKFRFCRWPPKTEILWLSFWFQSSPNSSHHITRWRCWQLLLCSCACWLGTFPLNAWTLFLLLPYVFFSLSFLSYSNTFLFKLA